MLKKIENGLNKIINAQTGRVKLVKHYKNGLVDGEIIYYWDNGQIRLTGPYENMRRIGIWKTYGPSGALVLEENFNSQDQIETTQLTLLPI